MTVESVILTVIAVMMMAIFLGPRGVNNTFDNATPRLAARVERNIAVGHRFSDARNSRRLPEWQAPPRR